MASLLCSFRSASLTARIHLTAPDSRGSAGLSSGRLPPFGRVAPSLRAPV